MKKIFLPLLLFSSFNSFAFTESEWIKIINDSIVPKEDLTWSYNMDKIKNVSKFIEDDDIKIFEHIAESTDLQISQGAKYLLSIQGQKTNNFILSNYLNDNNIKNGLFYLNLNLINTSDTKSFWKTVMSNENNERNNLIKEYEKCKGFNDLASIGGKDFTFESYDDFFNKRSLISNYTNADLFYLELDLQNQSYPITISFYNNKYVIQSNNNKFCTDIVKNTSYNKLQKIAAIYKQYEKHDILTSLCQSIDTNKLLKSRFSYFCSNETLKRNVENEKKDS